MQQSQMLCMTLGLDQVLRKASSRQPDKPTADKDVLDNQGTCSQIDLQCDDDSVPLESSTMPLESCNLCRNLMNATEQFLKPWAERKSTLVQIQLPDKLACSPYPCTWFAVLTFAKLAARHMQCNSFEEGNYSHCVPSCSSSGVLRQGSEKR